MAIMRGNLLLKMSRNTPEWRIQLWRKEGVWVPSIPYWRKTKAEAMYVYLGLVRHIVYTEEGTSDDAQRAAPSSAHGDL